jgi:hypothetical protein
MVNVTGNVRRDLSCQYAEYFVIHAINCLLTALRYSSYLAFLLMEHLVLTVEVTELCDLFYCIHLHIRLFRSVTRKDRLQKVKHLDC